MDCLPFYQACEISALKRISAFFHFPIRRFSWAPLFSRCVFLWQAPIFSRSVFIFFLLTFDIDREAL